MRVTNGNPLGCPLVLPVGTVNSVQTLKAWQGEDKVWRMATGCGDKKKGGACLFKSDNFVNWTAVGWLHHPQGPGNIAFWECPDFFEVPNTGKYVMKGSASGDWWSLGTYTEVVGMKEDTFTPISYDVRDGPPQGLGLQKYDFGQFYASKTFYDPKKQRQILWGYGVRFSTGICTRGCHWIPGMFA
jgi:beta-fructofuranosidase